MSDEVYFILKSRISFHERIALENFHDPSHRHARPGGSGTARYPKGQGQSLAPTFEIVQVIATRSSTGLCPEIRCRLILKRISFPIVALPLVRQRPAVAKIEPGTQPIRQHSSRPLHSTVPDIACRTRQVESEGCISATHMRDTDTEAAERIAEPPALPARTHWPVSADTCFPDGKSECLQVRSSCSAETFYRLVSTLQTAALVDLKQCLRKRQKALSVGTR